MQTFDYTTLRAICGELRQGWLPSRLEQVYQCDRHTITLALRTLKGRDWLTLCWHPQAARLHIGDPPPRHPDTFTFSDQLRHQLNGLALIALGETAPWERVIRLDFAQRPGDRPQWYLYVEIMGKYSNVILTTAENQIVTAAHQVSSQQSSVRPIQTGQTYDLPPALTKTKPSIDETFERWQQRVSLIPGDLQKQLLSIYGGVSPSLLQTLCDRAEISPRSNTHTLDVHQWHRLFQAWQWWLQSLESNQFQPQLTAQGYTVLATVPAPQGRSLQGLINHYYQSHLNHQEFQQLRHQLGQKLATALKKIRQKVQTFRDRLDQSQEAETYRHWGDLLMAHLHQWQPGLTRLTLTDYFTNEPVTLTLHPEKNAVQNAQKLYKQHQKLKRAKDAVQPLLAEATAEMTYLEQVEASLNQLQTYRHPDDLQTLWEIRQELVDGGYVQNQKTSQGKNAPAKPHIYRTPSGFELWIGRNNRQNDHLTFRTAGDYDLWFHSQEIAGSHVLLRLEPGAIAQEEDLQCAANFAAYYSRASESEQVPVIYTKPKYVYKPKGAKLGMAIYQRETVIWGQPQAAKVLIENDPAGQK